MDSALWLCNTSRITTIALFPDAEPSAIKTLVHEILKTHHITEEEIEAHLVVQAFTVEALSELEPQS